MNTGGKAMDHGSWGLQVLTRSFVGRLAHTKLSCQFASRTATQLFTQSLTTDATAASVLESSIIESDKELMMPKRSVVSSDRAAKYHRLTHVSGDGYIDLQFEKPPPKVPYKAIMLATVLFLVGSVLIIIGALLLAGIISSKYADRTWPVLIIGALMFIPGVYHVRIAYYAFRGYQGFSYEDIPEFD